MTPAKKIGNGVAGRPRHDAPEYELMRSLNSSDFTGVTCLDVGDPGTQIAWDAELPAPGQPFCYLVRATNGCPDGTGPLGAGTDGSPRPGAGCGTD